MFTINCRGRLWVVDKPAVMGIINATPDSFYNESRQISTDGILKQAEKMLEEGAAVLDIGGQSTRPGSEQLSAEEELQRVIPALDAIHRRWPDALLSIDTFYSRVATEALGAGAGMVNDVSAGTIDEHMIPIVASLKAPYVCMHMKGTPKTMQVAPQYENVTAEVLDFFIEKTAACTAAGIADVIIDPGFGFGKTIEHNFQLLKNLPVFAILQKPILAGLSRKSLISKTLNVTTAEALNGTTALHMLALQNGAAILRVHDVKEAVECVQLFKSYNKQ